MRSCVEEFETSLNNYKPTIVLLCEHWIPSGSEAFLNKIDNYRVASFYGRLHKSRGGVALLVRHDYEYVVRNDINELAEESVFECTAAEIIMKANNDKKSCLLISVYRTPNSNPMIFLQKLEGLFEKIRKDIKTKYIFIGGDFNINMMVKDSISKEFNRLIVSHLLSVTIDEPTRITQYSKTCIDNIITNVNKDLITSEILELGISDHMAIGIALKNCLHDSKSVFITKKVVSEDRLRSFLHLLECVKWDYCIEENSSENAFNIFFRLFNENFIKTFPTITVKLNNKQGGSKNNKWITTGIKNSIARKRELHTITKQGCSQEVLEYFRQYKHVLKKVINLAKRKANDDFFAKAKNINKATWQVVYKEIGKETRHQSIPDINSMEKIISNPRLKANAFNRFFITSSSVNLKTAYHDVSADLLSKSTSPKTVFSFSNVSDKDVIEIIENLKSLPTAGWDEIPTSVIKSSRYVIAKPLAHIINLAFKNGEFPSKLKYAIVKPLFKKGDQSKMENYRPVAILTVFSKVFEKAAHNQLSKYFEENNLLHQNQFGFRKGHSTRDAVSNVITDVLNSLDKQECAVGIFCDLSRAFDMVNHRLLLNKLRYYGLDSQSLNFFKSYLLDRKQRIKLTNKDCKCYFSEWETILCGVPQGSILGPLLFIIYVNDLPNNIKSNVFLFADDTTSIVTGTQDAVVENTKETMKEMHIWFRANGLDLNVKKTKLLSFKLRENSELEIILNQTFEGLIHKEACFLGIKMMNSLRWADQVDHIQNKISSVIYSLKVLKNVVNCQTLLRVFHGYLMSIIQYSIMFWGSGTINLTSIFRKQKKAMRVIDNLKPRDSCRNSFKKYNILTVPALYFLELAVFIKKKGDKLQNNQLQHGYGTRHRGALQYPRHRTSALEKGPFYSGLRIYNSLPAELRIIGCVKRFRKRLKELLTAAAPYTLEECFCLFPVNR